MAFVSIALPAIGSVASAALPALGTISGGLGTALSGLPMIGGPLSSVLGTTAGGGGLGGMFTSLGGASGLPGLTGTLGGGGGLFGGGGAAPNHYMQQAQQAGLMPNMSTIMPGSGGGIGQGFGLFGQGGLLGQGGPLTKLAQSPLFKTYQGLGKVAGIMDPPTGRGTGTGIGTGAAGASGPALSIMGGAPSGPQYGLQPGVLNFSGGGSPYGLDISPAVALEIEDLKDDVAVATPDMGVKATDSKDLQDSIERTNKAFRGIWGDT